MLVLLDRVEVGSGREGKAVRHPGIDSKKHTSTTTPPVGLLSHSSGMTKSAGGFPSTLVAGTHEMTMVGIW
jgi:hypothetical protein